MSNYNDGRRFFLFERNAEAYDTYSKGLAAGEIKCAFGLAHMLKLGYAGQKDEVRADKLIADNLAEIKALAQDGDIEAMFIYGCYGDSDGREWVERAAEQEYADAQHYCALHYSETKEDKRDWLLKAAEQGHVRAQYSLGMGDGDESVNWLEKAIEQGYTRAMYSLGMRYALGNGVEKNRKKAFEWFLRAAERGFTLAMCFVGEFYEKGDVVAQDYKKAVEWFTKSAEQDYPPALSNLGGCYCHGYGVERDLKKAKEYCERATALGSDCKDLLKEIQDQSDN